MTRLDPQLPPREVTPQERARSARTFGLILLGFVMVVGITVAYLSLRGRQVRDYGQAVYAAAQARVGQPGTGETGAKPAESAQVGSNRAGSGQVGAAQVSYDLPCTQVFTRPVPAAVQSCTVQVRSGQVAVVLGAGEGREFRVPPRH